MGTTTATLYIPMRALNGAYQGFGIGASRNLKGLKSYLPSASVPIGRVQGDKVLVDQQWYAFFNYFVNTYLDFSSAVTIGDLAQQMAIDQALAATTRAKVEVTSQQVIANAASSAATVSVLQTAALAGATQIPPVQLVPAEPIEFSAGAGGAAGAAF
jgi:hypothetical protein